jgi:hypothetical protein
MNGLTLKSLKSRNKNTITSRGANQTHDVPDINEILSERTSLFTPENFETFTKE